MITQKMFSDKGLYLYKIFDLRYLEKLQCPHDLQMMLQQLQVVANN